MNLPEPLVHRELDLRPFKIPMPCDTEEFSRSWILLDPDILAARLRLMVFAWRNNPTGSLPEAKNLQRAVAMGAGWWLRNSTEVLAEFVECSDGRFYHPFLTDQAKLAWACVEYMRLRSGSTRFDVRSSEWKAIRAGIFARDDFTCWYCGDRAGKLECDHVIPVAKGGSNEPENLVTACFKCNRSKGSKTLQEWAQ